MSRVQLDRRPFLVGPQKRLILDVTKAVTGLFKQNADGSVGAAATAYTTKSGGTVVTYPRLPGADGLYPIYVDPGEYFIQDADGDYFPWQAVSFTDIGGRVIGRTVLSTSPSAWTSIYPAFTPLMTLAMPASEKDVTLTCSIPYLSSTGSGIDVVLGIYNGSNVLIGWGRVTSHAANKGAACVARALLTAPAAQTITIGGSVLVAATGNALLIGTADKHILEARED